MSKYTAIIIEPRCHKALSFVLNNFFENLSDDWGFIIFHGNKNKDFLENILNNDLPMYKNRIKKIINMNIDNLLQQNYNDLLKTPSFYDNIDTELFMIFQIDCLIIKQNKHLIYDFLEYDYVGAPWSDKVVGNGGLSLRKKSVMLKIINEVDPHTSNYKNEDEYFTRQLNIDLFVPNFNKAKKFSVETQFFESPFGVHNCYNYLSSQDWNYLSNKYVDLKKLYELNNIIRDTSTSPITVVYTNDDDSLYNLKTSLLSLVNFVNAEEIYEIIIYIHNRISKETHDLLDIIQ